MLTVLALRLAGGDDLGRRVNQVVHIPYYDLLIPVLTPDILDGRVKDTVYPHSFLSSLIVETDGEITGWMAFIYELAEDDPGTTCIAGHDTLYGMSLCIRGPLVYVERLDPADGRHLLRCIIENDDVEIMKSDPVEFSFINVDRPVAFAALMGAELPEGYVPLAYDLAAAIFKQEAFGPPAPFRVCRF